ncbi:MAG: TorF family putative porin [Rubrivivax sp.]
MKKTLTALSALLTLGTLPSAAFADLAFNVGAVSDYRFRGMSQSRLMPALQGGVDWSANGFYAGAWASTIRWVQDLGGSGDIEIDGYGGYKGELIKDTLSYDVGALTYFYPGNNLKPSANTTEIYGALTFGPATVKYSHALTNTFGNVDSKNSGYLDVSASFDMGGGVMVTPHVGYQRISGPNSNVGSYVDMSLTLSKDFNGFVPSLAIVGNRSYDGAFYSSPYDGKSLAKATVVVGVKYNFGSIEFQVGCPA